VLDRPAALASSDMHEFRSMCLSECGASRQSSCGAELDEGMVGLLRSLDVRPVNAPRFAKLIRPEPGLIRDQAVRIDESSGRKRAIQRSAQDVGEASSVFWSDEEPNPDLNKALVTHAVCTAAQRLLFWKATRTPYTIPIPIQECLKPLHELDQSWEGTFSERWG
jgi:hypothetical protein